MSYLQDRKSRKKHTRKVIVLLAIIFVVIYFYANIFRGLSVATHAVFRPVVIFGNKLGQNINNNLAYFNSKKKLNAQNEDLEARILGYNAQISNYNTILAENTALKETLGRKESSELILASILSKPNKSPYDTLVLDVGEDQGILPGDLVFAEGVVPIGRIDQVFEKSSKAVLYSSAGEKKEVVIGPKGVYLETIGRGGGNFEMTIPRDMELLPGTEVTLPGIFPYTLAKVETIISDPRDSFVKALLVSPVNIFELKFVEVKK